MTEEMSVANAAVMLDCTAGNVYALIRKGDLPAHQGINPETGRDAKMVYKTDVEKLLFADEKARDLDQYIEELWG